MEIREVNSVLPKTSHVFLLDKKNKIICVGDPINYRRLSSKKVYIGDYQYPIEVPCCAEDESRYSGCSKELSGC